MGTNIPLAKEEAGRGLVMGTCTPLGSCLSGTAILSSLSGWAQEWQVGPESAHRGGGPHLHSSATILWRTATSVIPFPSHSSPREQGAQVSSRPSPPLQDALLTSKQQPVKEAGLMASGRRPENSGTDNCTLPMRALGPGTEVAPMPCCQRRGQDSILAPDPHSQDRAALSPGPPCPSGEQGRGLPVPWV